MKLTNFKSLCLALTMAPIASFGAIAINFSGVSFLDSEGNPIPDGALVQIIASTTDAIFSDPTPISFIEGDDRVIASFAMDSTTSGVPGGAVVSLQIPNYSTFEGFTPGDSLLVRWFPTLTIDSAAPGATTYGSYRTDLILDGSNIAWIAPADAGGNFTLSVVSVDFGGSVTNANLTANLVTAIPESSSFAALAGLMVVGAVATRRRRSA